MGTRSKTTIFNEEGQPLVSIYRQYDGYFEGMGADLQAFLSGMAITNGISGLEKKSANGMGCLAAQIIAHLKEGVGNVYITNHDDEQEYNYEVRFALAPANKGRNYFTSVGPNRVKLIGKCGDNEVKQFHLYPNEVLDLPILRRVQFVYDKKTGEQLKWRVLDVTEETATYLCGLENGEFKKFLKRRILDGKVLPA